MIKIDLKGCTPFVQEEKLNEYLDKALMAFDVLEAESGAGNDFLGWKTLPSDDQEKMISECELIKKAWERKGIDLVVVVGIGGSYLGAKCAMEALSHSFARMLKHKSGPEIVFAGHNMSEEYMAELMDLMRERNVACIVISKSGTTTEPAVAFRLIKHHIEMTYNHPEQRIIAVTDSSRGALKTLASERNFVSFVIPDNVGGRFSVLTPVGLLPLVIAGVDVRALLSGARKMQESLKQRSKDNPAVRYAAVRNLLHSDLGKSIEVLVSYNPKLTYLGEWWKQLYGESEGKDGKGIFPASVNFTTDLHSMGQFIQDGSRTMFETTINVEKSNRELLLENDSHNLDNLNYLAGKPVEYLNRMAMLGTQLAHIDGQVPQIELSVEHLSAESLGALFYFFEFACGVSAYLLGVNPFDQPGVEAYKKNMFALLGKPGFEAQGEELRKRLK